MIDLNINNLYVEPGTYGWTLGQKRMGKDKKTGAVSYRPFPISKVGRKYVYVQYSWYEDKFEMDIDESRFVEVKDWGDHEILYFSEQDARDRVERMDCEKFLDRLNSWELRHYSLETLRKVVRILKAEEVPDDKP